MRSTFCQAHHLTFGGLCGSLLWGFFLGSWFVGILVFGGLFGCCDMGLRLSTSSATSSSRTQESGPPAPSSLRPKSPDL